MRTPHRINSTILSFVTLVALVGCDQDQESSGPMPGAHEDPASDSGPASTPDASDGEAGTSSDPDPVDPPPPELEPLTGEQVQSYLSRVAPIIAGRSISFDESETAQELGEAAIEPMLRAWTEEPGFADAIRYLVQDQLHVSGQREGVDYELPGNLAAEVAREALPWSTILTADYCVDNDGAHIECDTGAPYAAGVLATRAYLIVNNGRFNLSRAKLMLETFACRIYPMEHEVQPPLEKPMLIPLFRAETPEEQTVDEAEGGFGNGIGCYLCHSQFGAHAQLFVKFDAAGNWKSDATGLQDPDNELGRSFDGLYTSHMFDEGDAARESTQVFGETVANLSEAGEVIADSELFPICTVKNLIAHAFDLKAGADHEISEELTILVAERVMAGSSSPSIGDYIIATFTDPSVIRAAIGH